MVGFLCPNCLFSVNVRIHGRKKQADFKCECDDTPKLSLFPKDSTGDSGCYVWCSPSVYYFVVPTDNLMCLSTTFEESNVASLTGYVYQGKVETIEQGIAPSWEVD